MSTTEKYFKIKNGLQFDDGTTLTTAPAGGSFSGSYNDLTDKPTIPSTTGLASESFVTTAISNLVDTAPTTLDTLNELAAALGDDPNFATTVTTALGNKVNASSLATVATTGSYNDLTDRPTSAGTPTNVMASEVYTNTTNAILFGDVSTTSTQDHVVHATTNLTYNPVSGQVSAQSYYGSAANLYNFPPAVQVNITSIDGNASDTTTYIPMVANLATGGQALHIDTGFVYNANSNVLNVGTTGSHNGSVGATTPSTGAFTTLTASSGINSTAIGATTPSTGAFTTLTASSGINSTAIGATTASTGKFTTLTATGTTTLATALTGILKASSGVISVATAGSDFVAFGGALGTPTSGTVTNLTGTASININGTVGATTPTTGSFTNLTVSGTVTAGGGVGTSGQVLQSTGTGVQWATTSSGGSNIIDIISDSGQMTMPGTINAATTSIWTLNTAGGISGVSVSGGTFTLPAGTYVLRLPFMVSTNTTKGDIRLRNTTDGTNIQDITYETMAATYGGFSNRGIYGTPTIKFTLTGSKTLTFAPLTALGTWSIQAGAVSNGYFGFTITKVA